MKYKIISALIGAAVVLIPTSSAFAMTVDSLTFDNGTPNIVTNPGDTINATAYFTLSGSDQLDTVSVEFPGYGSAEQCFRVDPALLQPGASLPVPINNLLVPNNAGAWNILIKGYSETWPSLDTQCDPSNQKSSKTFSEVVNVTANSVTTINGNGNFSGNNGTSTSQNNQLSQLIALLTALISKQTTTPPPTTSAVCTAYAQASAGAMQGVTNSANVRLQGFLLSQGESIPALAAGASFGFFGQQTAAANSTFQAANHC